MYQNRKHLQLWMVQDRRVVLGTAAPDVVGFLSPPFDRLDILLNLFPVATRICCRDRGAWAAIEFWFLCIVKEESTWIIPGFWVFVETGGRPDVPKSLSSSSSSSLVSTSASSSINLIYCNTELAIFSSYLIWMYSLICLWVPWKESEKL